MRRIFAIVLCAACRPTPTPMVTPEVPDNATTATVTPRKASPFGEILAALVPVTPGTTWIPSYTGDALRVCESLRYPESLPGDAAATVTDHPPGSKVTIVHVGGNTEVEIVAIGCEPPGDIEPAIANLELRSAAPEGPPDPRLPESMRGRLPGRPHLAVVGADVASTATLVDPVPVDMRGAAAKPWREIIGTWVGDRAHAELDACTGSGDPAERPSHAEIDAALPAAVQAADVHLLRDGEDVVAFAVVHDDDVSFDCYGQGIALAMLFDARGDLLYDETSNNGIELMWQMDLDGNGIDEALLDVHQLEDGGHQIVLLHELGIDAWDDVVIWSSASP